MDHTGAIFDMDGVLFDTERVYQQTWHELAGERQINLGSGFLKAITGTNGDRMRRVVEEYYQVSDGLAVMEECMKRMREKLAAHIPVKDGVPEILHFFRAHGGGQQQPPRADRSQPAGSGDQGLLRRSGQRDGGGVRKAGSGYLPVRGGTDRVQSRGLLCIRGQRKRSPGRTRGRLHHGHGSRHDRTLRNDPAILHLDLQRFF